MTEAVDVEVENRHLGTHSGGDHGGVRPSTPRSEDRHSSRGHTGDTADQHSPAAMGTLQKMGSGLSGHPPCDLAHRRQKWEGAGGELNGLVGDRGRPRGDQPSGLYGVGGEMEKGEERVLFGEQLRLRPL